MSVGSSDRACKVACGCEEACIGLRVRASGAFAASSGYCAVITARPGNGAPDCGFAHSPTFNGSPGPYRPPPSTISSAAGASPSPADLSMEPTHIRAAFGRGHMAPAPVQHIRAARSKDVVPASHLPASPLALTVLCLFMFPVLLRSNLGAFFTMSTQIVKILISSSEIAQ
jgi:hypothetical protein